MRPKFLGPLLAAIALWPGTADAAESAGRGAYLFAAAGCANCHTDKAGKGAPLAGGRRLKTPFGDFYSPNITPDPEHGIGRWSEDDFQRALRDGVAPDGSHYFPVFPYASFTLMTDRDIRDLRAYIFSLGPRATPNKPHRVDPPFGWRFLVPFWKWLYFTPGPFTPDPGRNNRWNRGAYLVRALGHCGECHTPRGWLGGPRDGMDMAGTGQGPQGGSIPNITPDAETGIGRWSDSDYHSLLKMGMTPDGDFVDGAMGEVVENTTSRLNESDLQAMIHYLKSLPAVDNRVEKEDKDEKGEKEPWE